MLLPVTSSSSRAAFMPLRPTPMAANSFIPSQPSVDQPGAGEGGGRGSARRVGVRADLIGAFTQPGERLLDSTGPLGEQVSVDPSDGPQFLDRDEDGGAALLASRTH